MSCQKPTLPAFGGMSASALKGRGEQVGHHSVLHSDLEWLWDLIAEE